MPGLFGGVSRGDGTRRAGIQPDDAQVGRALIGLMPDFTIALAIGRLWSWCRSWPWISTGGSKGGGMLMCYPPRIIGGGPKKNPLPGGRTPRQWVPMTLMT